MRKFETERDCNINGHKDSIMTALKYPCFHGNSRVIISSPSKHINLGLVTEYSDYMCVSCYNKNNLPIFLC